MVNEMDKETRDRVMAQLLNYSIPSKSANKSGRKVSSKANAVTGTWIHSGDGLQDLELQARAKHVRRIEKPVHEVKLEDCMVPSSCRFRLALQDGG